MTIERNVFVDKPVLATMEEGPMVAQQRFMELVSHPAPPGSIMRIIEPEGKYKLLPNSLTRQGDDFTLQVMENGKCEMLLHASSPLTIDAWGNEVSPLQERVRMPGDCEGLPIILESEDGRNLELHEFIFYYDGPNPPKEVISFS